MFKDASTCLLAPKHKCKSVNESTKIIVRLTYANLQRKLHVEESKQYIYNTSLKMSTF